MSPRSTEFFEAAKRRLALAANAIDQDPGGALSAAYYSLLYATRAALSEHDKYAKSRFLTAVERLIAQIEES